MIFASRAILAAALVLGALHGSASAAETCPPSFADFVTRFRADVSFQKEHTARELTVSQVIDADPEPKTVVRKVNSSGLTFPLMQSLQTQRRLGLKIDLQRSNSISPVVIVRKPDTDQQVRFTFRKDACWLLVRRDDESL